MASQTKSCMQDAHSQLSAPAPPFPQPPRAPRFPAYMEPPLQLHIAAGRAHAAAVAAGRRRCGRLPVPRPRRRSFRLRPPVPLALPLGGLWQDAAAVLLRLGAHGGHGGQALRARRPAGRGARRGRARRRVLGRRRRRRRLRWRELQQRQQERQLRGGRRAGRPGGGRRRWRCRRCCHVLAVARGGCGCGCRQAAARVRAGVPRQVAGAAGGAGRGLGFMLRSLFGHALVFNAASGLFCMDAQGRTCLRMGRLRRACF